MIKPVVSPRRRPLLTALVLAPIALAAALTTSATGCKSSSDSGGADQACDDYFQALFVHGAAGCKGITYSNDKLASLKARFRTLCNDALSAPGEGITAGFLETCAQATAGAACGSPDPDVCKTDGIVGKLANGAACGDDTQCASSYCPTTELVSASDGGAASARCGVCTARVADGAPCANGARCVTEDTCGPQGVCVKKVVSDVGGPCGTNGASCKTGLSCGFSGGSPGTTPTCRAPGASGAACQQSIDCTPDLGCVGGKCAPRAAAGAACQSDECQTSLVCSAGVCTKPVSVDPGGACDLEVHVCATGSCNLASNGGPGTASGTCPTVIPDGKPCSPRDHTQTCDDFAECVGGVCVLQNPASCK